MRWRFRRKGCPGHEPRPGRRRIPLFCVVLMALGLMTMLYFLIVYALIPVLALMS